MESLTDTSTIEKSVSDLQPTIPTSHSHFTVRIQIELHVYVIT